MAFSTSRTEGATYPNHRLGSEPARLNPPLGEPQHNTLSPIPYQPLTLPSHVQFYGSTRGTFAQYDRVWRQPPVSRPQLSPPAPLHPCADGDNHAQCGRVSASRLLILHIPNPSVFPPLSGSVQLGFSRRLHAAKTLGGCPKSPSYRHPLPSLGQALRGNDDFPGSLWPS